MLKWMTKTKAEEAALLAGDNQAVALAMYRAHYYGGFHPNKKEQAAGMGKAAADAANVQDRVLWIHNAVMEIAKAIGEPVAVDAPAPVTPSTVTPVAGSGGGVLAVAAMGVVVAGAWWVRGKVA